MASSRIRPSEETLELLKRYISCGEHLVKISQELSDVPGAGKLERKCLAELKYLKSLSRRRGGYDVTHLRSSNINHYAGVLHAAKSVPEVTHILQAFRCPERLDSLHVDVVGAQGHVWIKVIARKAQALHLIWAGQGQFGERDIVNQGLDYIAASKVHPVNFMDPIIVFAFYGGITSTLAEKIREIGIIVIGHEVPLDSTVEQKIAGLSFRSDESDNTDADWCNFVEGVIHDSDSASSARQTEYQDAFEARLNTVYLRSSEDIEGLSFGQGNNDDNASAKINSVDGKAPNCAYREGVFSRCVTKDVHVVNDSPFEELLACEYFLPVDDGGDDQRLFGKPTADITALHSSGDKECDDVSCTTSTCSGEMATQHKLVLDTNASITSSKRTDFCKSSQKNQHTIMTMDSLLHTTETKLENKNFNQQDKTLITTLLMDACDGNRTSQPWPQLTTVREQNQLQSIDLADTHKEYNSDEIVSGDKNTCQSIRESNQNSALDNNMSLSELSNGSQFSSETNTQAASLHDVKCGHYSNIEKWNFPDTAIQTFIENEILGNTLITYADLESVLQKSTFKSIDNNPRVNLDVTTLITLVSSVANGNCYFKFQEKILAQQAEDERTNPVLPKLKAFLEGKELFSCITAIDSFKNILDTLGGPVERRRAEKLLSIVTVVPDDPSFRTTSIPNTGKIKDRSKIIFGTGDSLRAVTVTANSGFVRAANHQGVLFSVFLHASRALTEQREANAEEFELI